MNSYFVISPALVLILSILYSIEPAAVLISASSVNSSVYSLCSTVRISLSNISKILYRSLSIFYQVFYFVEATVHILLEFGVLLVRPLNGTLDAILKAFVL